MTIFPGQILVIDLRDALPNEPGKRARPCVVVQNSTLFDDRYQNVIIVPLTRDIVCSIDLLMTTIDPTTENGCPDRCYAVAAHVASTSRSRIVRLTDSRVTDEQLTNIRAQVALAIAA